MGKTVNKKRAGRPGAALAKPSPREAVGRVAGRRPVGLGGASASEMTAGEIRSSCNVSGRLQPPDFRLEFKAQLRALLVGQPVRHLRKDGPVEQDRLRLP